MERTLWENRKYTISKCISLYKRCISCNREFNNLVDGVEYSSTVIGISIFEIATSIGLVLAFIGGVLFLGSKVVPLNDKKELSNLRNRVSVVEKENKKRRNTFKVIDNYAKSIKTRRKKILQKDDLGLIK